MLDEPLDDVIDHVMSHEQVARLVAFPGTVESETSSNEQMVARGTRLDATVQVEQSSRLFLNP